ncbi:MAG: hypothetical protein RBR28_13015 [Lentimicrobium sp.]|jgi:hypothetical protein|nr:hypothetical protein [Lentimicrobium sp.]
MKHMNQIKKSSLKTFVLLSLAASCLLALSSCGSIAGAITQGKRPAYIVNSPQDVSITQNGEALDISSELFASTGFDGTTIDYYTAAIKLPYKKPLTLEFKSGNRTGTIDLKPKGTRYVFWGNLIFFPIVGHIIDAVTHNSKSLQPRYIDVESVLNHVPQKEWASQKKLKRLEKRKIKKA